MIFRRADKDKLSKSYLIGWALYELRGHGRFVTVPAVSKILLKVRRLSDLSSITAEPVSHKDVALILEKWGLKSGETVPRDRYVTVCLDLLSTIDRRLEKILISRIEHDLE